MQVQPPCPFEIVQIRIAEQQALLFRESGGQRGFLPWFEQVEIINHFRETEGGRVVGDHRRQSDCREDPRQ